MKKWAILSGAIALEVPATLALRASIENPWWLVLTVVGYMGSMVGLAALLRLKTSIGAIYGIWAAAGVALTAVSAALVFNEPLNLWIGVGVGVVICGVVLVETGHPSTNAHEEVSP